MAVEVANYPPLYLTLISLSTLLPLPKLYAIKLISVVGDYVAAWLVWRLVRRLGPASPGATRMAHGANAAGFREVRQNSLGPESREASWNAPALSAPYTDFLRGPVSQAGHTESSGRSGMRGAKPSLGAAPMELGAASGGGPCFRHAAPDGAGSGCGQARMRVRCRALWRFRASRGFAAALIFLCLPTVVMNSSLWGQCDVLYTSGFLASLLFLLEGRPVAAMVAFGVSCSLKPQAVFWCPLVLGLLLSRRLPWKSLWVPVAVYALSGLPSLLAGRSVLDILTFYARVQNLPGLALNAPNWYQWISPGGSDHFLRWTGTGLALLATAAFAWWMKQGPGPARTESSWLVQAAFLSVLFPPFLLPGMHDRYFYPADVISVLYAFCVPGGWVAVVLMQVASGFAYCPFLFREEPVPLAALALALAAALEWVVIRTVVRPHQPRSRAANGAQTFLSASGGDSPVASVRTQKSAEPAVCPTLPSP